MKAAGYIRSGRLLGLAVLAAVAAPALPLVLRADPVPPPAAPAPPLTVPRPDMPEAGGRRAANGGRVFDNRIEQLRTGLQLTPAQERLWPPVADAIRDLREARGRGFRQQLEAAADTNDKLKLQGDHMAKVGAAMSKLADATKPLADGLTAEQKGKLPALMERAPLRRVVARAFGSPAEAAFGPGAAGQIAAPPAPGATAAPARPPGDTGTTSQPSRDPDDDE